MIGWGELAQLEWRNPWWGMLAFQPLAMELVARLRRRRTLHYAQGHLLPWAVRLGTGGHGLRRKAMLLLAWALLAGAAAGPRLPLDGHARQARPQHDMDLMVVLDVSPSMLAQDVSPQRLARAKLELLDLLPQLRGERLGLVVFSAKAGLLMPLSRDYGAFRYYLNLAAPALFTTPGSNIAAALDLARRQLVQHGHGARAVVLLSDGEGSALTGPQGAAARRAAAQLKAAAIPLYILGLGTAAGAPVGPAAATSRMDAAACRQLAHLAGGRFVALDDTPDPWRALYDNGLLTLAATHRPPSGAQGWRQLYAWLLAPALLLFWLAAFPLPRASHRAGAAFGLALLLVAAAVSGRPARAAQTGPQAAYAAYRRGDYGLAQALYGQRPGYAARLGEGAASYRRADYGHAAQQFTQALLRAQTGRQRADALFDLGNARYRAGDFRRAVDAYRGTLRYRPDDRNAALNLSLAAGKIAAAEAARHAAGILGRRGRQTGGRLGTDIRHRPVFMAPGKEKKGPMAALPQDWTALDKARLRQEGKTGADGQPGPWRESERAYRAALKKLYLLADHPAALQKQMIKQDTPSAAPAPKGMPPW